MTCYLLVYDHLSLQIIQMDISNVSLCSQRYVLCMRKPTRFFPIYQRGDLQYPSFFHPSRSRVPSPSTRRTRWWFAIWVVFLRACVSSKKKRKGRVFHTSSSQASIFFLFLFWGAQEKAVEIWESSKLCPSTAAWLGFSRNSSGTAMAVEKTDAVPVDVADAMVKAVRQAVETTLQKLG